MEMDSQKAAYYSKQSEIKRNKAEYQKKCFNKMMKIKKNRR